MKALNCTEADLQKAAKKTGVRLMDARPEGTGVRFRLALVGEKYRRMGHTGRKVAAVCWHGHQDFFRALFRINPKAKIRTCQAAYDSPEHFERTYGDTNRNIGSMIQPLYYADACWCNDGVLKYERAESTAVRP